MIAFLLFLSLASQSHAQDGNEYCFHQETTSGINKFLNYLIKKYGIEHSEKILLNVKAYEATHEVFVLYKTEYQLISEKIQLLISQSSDAAVIEHLKARRAKIVLFDTIEQDVNH